MTKVPDSIYEIYAWCVNDQSGLLDNGIPNPLRIMSLYKVKAFIEDQGFYPYGVELVNSLNKDIPGLYFLQQFIYIEICLS